MVNLKWRRQMNILLWVLQIALALLCIAGGTFKIFKIEQLQKNVASMRALPRGLVGASGMASRARICAVERAPDPPRRGRRRYLRPWVNACGVELVQPAARGLAGHRCRVTRRSCRSRAGHLCPRAGPGTRTAA